MLAIEKQVQQQRKKLLAYYPASRIIRSHHCYNFNINKELRESLLSWRKNKRLNSKGI
jgi:hypothetical protein